MPDAIADPQGYTDGYDMPGALGAFRLFVGAGVWGTTDGERLEVAVPWTAVGLPGPASLLYGIMDPGGIVNTISKRPELYQHGSVTLLGSTFANNRSGADGTLDITGPIGDGGLAYRFIGYGVSEDYWRNFGRHREMLVNPSLAW